MNVIFELEEQEKKWWKNTIKKFRADYVPKPKVFLDEVIQNNPVKVDQVREDISSFIHKTREACWGIYLEREIEFHREAISHLIKSRDLPSSILKTIIERDLLKNDILNFNKENIFEKLTDTVGDFAGRIMPYFYELSLSTTNSRRSRAGKTFEAIIEYTLGLYGYPYNNQSSLGTSFYSDNGIGKMVDVVIPDKESYNSNRGKCIIITMKTTLRELWQEVVEELNRTKIPNIYLLTLDHGFSETLLLNMKRENIIVVVYDKVKAKLANHDNVKSFKQFFNEEIPHTLDYWIRIK
jgi:hypothetical protein